MIPAQKQLQKLFFASGLLLFSIVFGVVGFMYIETHNFRDAFYMTVITISTVGFGTVEQLSPDGKLFVSFFILFNLGIFGYFISVMSTYLFEGELRNIYYNIMSSREVKKMKDHVIVCGYGRNGSRACDELAKSNEDFVVIEQEIDVIKNKLNPTKIAYIEGDATQDEILKLAGVERAKSLITTMPKDADNVFIVLTARELNPKVEIISRASEETSEKKLLRAGANHIVMPDSLGGVHMASLVTQPGVVEFLELVNGVGDRDLKLEEVSFEDLKPSYRNKSIRELDIRNKTGVMIVAFKQGFSQFEFNPSAETKIDNGCTLIILGSINDIQTFNKTYLDSNKIPA